MREAPYECRYPSRLLIVHDEAFRLRTNAPEPRQSGLRGIGIVFQLEHRNQREYEEVNGLSGPDAEVWKCEEFGHEKDGKRRRAEA